MNANELNEEVWVARESVVVVSSEDVNFLKAKASSNSRSKSRLLLHRSVDDTLHEMVIIHSKGQYIQPLRNVGTSKSFHLIEGSTVCVIFSDEGEIVSHHVLGEYSGNSKFMIRISDDSYHTLIPLTDKVVFVEAILGPFKRAPRAHWAPKEGDTPEAREYFANLCAALDIRI